MHPPSQLILDLPESCPHAIAPCYPLHEELPTAVAAITAGVWLPMENLPDGRPRASSLNGSTWAKLDLHRRKSVPERGRGKKRPSFVNFRLVAPQELSDFRGDTG